MPLRINTAEFKTAARLAAHVSRTNEDVDSNRSWRTLYRLAASGERLWLEATDAETFLRWAILRRDGVCEADFDGTISIKQFRKLGNCEGDKEYWYEVSKPPGNDPFMLKHRDRVLRFPSYPSGIIPPWPQPDQADGVSGQAPVSVRMSAQQLAKALRFIIPFMDVENPNAAKSAVTLYPDGTLIAGQPGFLAFIEGLPPCPVSVSLHAKAARIAAAFLNELEGDVEVRSRRDRLDLNCPTHGHSLSVLSPPVTFPDLRESYLDRSYESCRIDRKSLHRSVSSLEATLIGKEKRIAVNFRGVNQTAAVLLATPLEDEFSSHDTIQISRDYIQTEPPPGEVLLDMLPETSLKMEARKLRSVLRRMESMEIEVRLYSGHRFTWIREAIAEDRAAHANGGESSLVRTVVLPAQQLQAG